MAANRQDGFAGSIKRVWGRGGVFGCKFDHTNLNTTIEANTAFPQFTKASFHGPGSKPPPKEPSSSSSHPKPNTTLATLVPPPS